MSDQDDIHQLADLSDQLAPIDLDDTSAQRIALRARVDVGRGPSPRRFVEPILVAVFALSFLIWTLSKMLGIYR